MPELRADTPEQLHDWMRQIRERTTGPFDGNEPVALEELTAEQLGWRAAMYLLAEHGAQVAVPVRLCPPVTVLQIAAGWLYAVQLTPTADGKMLMSARYAADVGQTPGADIEMPPLQVEHEGQQDGGK